LKEIKPPQFLSDVYRDLRDRHLLLPALALLVGLFAVPTLLKSSDTPLPPAPATATASGHASAVSAAVLADDTVSVRNYRKRLEDLKSKNPFKPQFVAATGGGGGTGAGGGGATTTTPTSPTSPTTAPTTAPTGSPTTTTDTTGGTTTPPTTTTTPDTTTPDNGGGGNGNGGNQPSSHDVEVVTNLVTRRVDLMIGLQGDPKLRENVKPMTILPDATTPVVAYLGTDEKGKRAAFVVSKDATMVAGDGACVPTPENCLYITLQKNETATLSFGPDGQTYDLRLLEIRDHELKAE
jgi:hypothetical protein